MSNMSLWESVKVTDPAAVKPITGKSYKGDSPKPYWLIEQATKKFGPIGIGWGVIVKSERFERMSDTDVLHVAVVSVWFMHEGKRSETFDQMGGTKAAYMTASGKLSVDEDAGKKSVTDGMVKCLSMIGFAGDIFAGQWNDSKYVEWAREQYAPLPPTLNEMQIAEITKLVNETGADFSALMAWVSKAAGHEVTSLQETPAEAYTHIVKQLNKKRVSA